MFNNLEKYKKISKSATLLSMFSAIGAACLIYSGIAGLIHLEYISDIFQYGSRLFFGLLLFLYCLSVYTNESISDSIYSAYLLCSGVFGVVYAVINTMMYNTEKISLTIIFAVFAVFHILSYVFHTKMWKSTLTSIVWIILACLFTLSICILYFADFAFDMGYMEGVGRVVIILFGSLISLLGVISVALTYYLKCKTTIENL